MTHIDCKWIFFENVYDTARFLLLRIKLPKAFPIYKQPIVSDGIPSKAQVPKHTCYVKSTVYFKPSIWSNAGAVAVAAAFDQMDHKHKYLSNTLYIYKNKNNQFSGKYTKAGS